MRTDAISARASAVGRGLPEPLVDSVRTIPAQEDAMLSRARYILLNAYHILIDGLFDAVPILLAFMVISFGEGEKAVGLIVSVGTAAGTAAGLGTLLLARKLGFMQTITLVTSRVPGPDFSRPPSPATSWSPACALSWPWRATTSFIILPFPTLRCTPKDAAWAEP